MNSVHGLINCIVYYYMSFWGRVLKSFDLWRIHYSLHRKRHFYTLFTVISRDSDVLPPLSIKKIVMIWSQDFYGFFFGGGEWKLILFKKRKGWKRGQYVTNNYFIDCFKREKNINSSDTIVCENTLETSQPSFREVNEGGKNLTPSKWGDWMKGKAPSSAMNTIARHFATISDRHA